MQENLPLHSFHKKTQRFSYLLQETELFWHKSSNHFNKCNMHHLTVQRQWWPWSRYKTSILSYISSKLPFCCVSYKQVSQSKCSCSCNKVLNIWHLSFFVFILRYLKWWLGHALFFLLFFFFLFQKVLTKDIFKTFKF